MDTNRRDEMHFGLVKNASERHYVRAGQIYMIPMVLIAGALTLYAVSRLNIVFVVLSVMSGYWRVMAWCWHDRCTAILPQADDLF